MNKYSSNAHRLVWLLVLGLITGPQLSHAASDDTKRKVKFNEGIVAFTQRDYATAEGNFEELAAQDASDVGALYWLGLCQLQRNKYASASATFQKVLELSPERVEIRLDAAMALVGQDRFNESKSLLKDFMASGAGDPATRNIAQFFLGVVEYKTADYDEALKALDAAQENTTDSAMLANIAWYRAWVLTEQLKPEEAAAEFKKVSELSTNVDQQIRARNLADQVVAGMKVQEIAPISQFQLRVDFGLNYDTNVVLLGENTSLPVDLATNENIRWGLGTDARYLQPLGEKWLLGVGGTTFNSWHADLQEFNVQTYGGRTFLNYFANDRMTFGLQYEYDFSLVDNDAFLSRNRLTPSFRLIESFHQDGTPLTSSTFFYSYEDRNYHDDLKIYADDRDGDYHSVGVTQNFNIAQIRKAQGDDRWLAANIGYRFMNESTQGNNFDLDGHLLSAGFEVPLPAQWLFSFDGQWTWEDYWQPNSQDFKKRERSDMIQQYIFSLGREWEIDRNIVMALRGEIVWTQDDSNVKNRLREAIYSYDRVIYGLTLSFTFR